ncbi:MAG: hypothetical protein D3922_16125 [Candidatus Electrothrix sp. AR1]|nr:hypothetical protein [Candidatus Electrothrix sp. AR1]
MQPVNANQHKVKKNIWLLAGQRRLPTGSVDPDQYDGITSSTRVQKFCNNRGNSLYSTITLYRLVNISAIKIRNECFLIITADYYNFSAPRTSRLLKQINIALLKEIESPE